MLGHNLVDIDTLVGIEVITNIVAIVLNQYCDIAIFLAMRRKSL